MVDLLLNGFRTLNDLLSAGIAITAFSLLLYALSFNLRDRVVRSFAIILICVVIVFVADTIAGTSATPSEMDLWFRLQWVGIAFLPAAYMHFSDALLDTTGIPSPGRRRILARFSYLISFGFLVTLPFSLLVGPLIQTAQPAPHLQRTWLTWVFTAYYVGGMVWAWLNFYKAYQHTVTRTSRRRMKYLLAGALAPALGSYPYLLFGSGLVSNYPLVFWLIATFSNLMVYALLVVMAYSVSFFGVSWPDRVVKRRLFKWLMRGPVTASLVLAMTTLVRRYGSMVGLTYPGIVPFTMVGSLLVFEHLITLAAPVWERWLFHGRDQANIQLLQNLEERLLTTGDLRQFLESVLAAVCDRLQTSRAFIITLGVEDPEIMVAIGGDDVLSDELSDDILEVVVQNGFETGFFEWGKYWLVPLFSEGDEEEPALLGIMGAVRDSKETLDEEEQGALTLLSQRAALALQERQVQQQVFNSLKTLTPQVDMIQRLRAASRYDGTGMLTSPDNLAEQMDMAKWVKDALTHYWGGPKLTQSPLMKFKIVQEAAYEHSGNSANALRAILSRAIEQTRPEGERRFTGEWILYNILEMKFLEGYKVRDIATRLAMSEADLYRKQRVAIDAVATAIAEMESKAKSKSINESDVAIGVNQN